MNNDGQDIVTSNNVSGSVTAQPLVLGPRAS
jgi:hypothetical protein